MFRFSVLAVLVTTLVATRAQSSMDEISVAFLGNSILYYNDCPRVVENMLKATRPNVRQKSCLNGAESLRSLFRKGNSVFANEFDDPGEEGGALSVQDLLKDEDWNFVVLNDYTQGPARPGAERDATIKSLMNDYGPLLRDSVKTSSTPSRFACSCTLPGKNVAIAMQTFAYRSDVEGSADLGGVEEFTTRLRAGYDIFADVLSDFTDMPARVAPVGDAFLSQYDNNRELWEKLFYSDDVHPSPHGTWLQACVLYCTMLDEPPPTFRASFFDDIRFTPEGTSLDPLPADEAEELRQTACDICGITCTSEEEQV